MSTYRQIAARLMAPGTGILAADESITTMSNRRRKAGSRRLQKIAVRIAN